MVLPYCDEKFYFKKKRKEKKKLLLFHKNVALHATMVSDDTIAQTDITIAAPWQLATKLHMTTLYSAANAIQGTENCSATFWLSNINTNV